MIVRKTGRKGATLFLALALAAAAASAENASPKGAPLFKLENFNDSMVQACGDTGPAPFRTNCLVDCSALLARSSQRAPAALTITNKIVQIACPANGCYKVKWQVAAAFKPGQNYLWSLTCWQRPLVETQKHEAVVSYKLGDSDDGGRIKPGFAVTKTIVLTGGGYTTHTFTISIPPDAGDKPRTLDLEISNENLADTGGVIKIMRMQIMPEVNEHEVYSLWPALLPPGQKEVLPNQEWLYMGRYYCDISRPAVIVYRPPETNRQPVGVLVCSGGSFHLLESMAKDAAWLNSLGITAFELRYRVPSKSNEPQKALQDAQRALRLIRSKAKELGLAKLGIMGGSAGAHLAIMAATNFERPGYEPRDEIDQLDCRPDFVISIASPYVFKPDGTLSDDIHIDDKTPPAFFAHGDADKYSAVNSATLYSELRKRGIPAELHVWAKAGHGIGIDSEIGREWSRLCEKWLKTMEFIKADE